jgi:hypothetical protein
MRPLGVLVLALLLGDAAAKSSKGKKKEAAVDKKPKKKAKVKKVAIDAAGLLEDAGDDEGDAAPNEEVLWRQGDSSPPVIPGVTIYLPEAISRISRFAVKHDDDSGVCGYTHFTAVRDARGDLLVASVDDFFGAATVADLRDHAVNFTDHGGAWSWADIHPNMQKHLKKDKRKGIGFPGLRLHASNVATPLVVDCLKPVMKIVNAKFNFKKIKDSQSMFGLIHPHEGLKDKHGKILWLDSERLPRVEIRWDYGTLPGGVVPQSYATELPLMANFNESGTGLWRERSSKLHLLKTVAENEEAQGNMNPHVANRKHPELDLLEEIPDPNPYALTAHAWAECILVQHFRLNRLALYDGRSLHSYYISAQDHKRLSKDPARGRLTMDSYFWNKGGA